MITIKAVGVYACLEDVIPSQEEITACYQGVKESSWRPVLLVARDGAHVPTRPKAKRNEKRGRGRGQEAKGFRIYLLGKDRIAHVASWHQIQNGAWWVKETGNEMLGNRCAIYNGTCGKILEKYKKAQNPL